MALQYRQVQFHFSMCSPDFFCSHTISQYLTRFFNVGLKGPQFHSPVGPPPWHTWAAIRCRFAALQSDWGTHRLAWSQWNWQWCLLQLANDIGSSSREKCDTSQCRAHLKHKVAEKVLMRRKRDVESSSDLNVLQCTSMIFNVHYNTIVRECQRSHASAIFISLRSFKAKPRRSRGTKSQRVVLLLFALQQMKMWVVGKLHGTLPTTTMAQLCSFPRYHVVYLYHTL